MISNIIPRLLSEKGTWDEQRRNEIKQLFAHEVYGERPNLAYTVTSLLLKSQQRTKQIKQEIVQMKIETEKGAIQFPLYCYFPLEMKENQKVPFILFICTNHRLSISAGDDLEHNLQLEYWPVEQLVSQGYATAAFYAEDVEPDCEANMKQGILSLFNEDIRPMYSWGAIAGWAFGASRVIDIMVNDVRIDCSQIILAGHSRGGKTALWCSANDSRIQCCYANCSGCTGAALSRGKEGESVALINKTFPYWFCQNYKKYNFHEEQLPVDQHMLLALIAPRYLYIVSASEDTWADPKAEFSSVKYASEVWGQYGRTGLECTEFPTPGYISHSGDIGYHLRPGKHALTKKDWSLFCDFWRQKQ